MKRTIMFAFVTIISTVNALEAPPEINHQWEERILGVRKNVDDLADAVEELTFGITEPDFGVEFAKKLRVVLRRSKSGEYVECWPNGKMKARLGFKNREADGHIHGWYEDGTDAFKGYYKEGVKQGIHIVFHPPANRKKSLDARVLSYNELGQLDGHQTTILHDSDLRVSICYRNGIAEGPLECWDGQGRHKLSAQYKNGKLLSDGPTTPKKREQPVPKHQEEVSDIIKVFEKEIEEEFHLTPARSGGTMTFDVESIAVGFTVNRRGTIDEARELEVVLTDRLTKRINEHEGLRPYLREYPFPRSRAHVSLTFRNPDGSAFKDGSVTFVSMREGEKIYYHGEDPMDPSKNMDLHEESYETAIKKIKAKKDECSSKRTKEGANRIRNE